MLNWIDSHCHLDAFEFDADRDECRSQAKKLGVVHCIYPAVVPANFEQVQALAHRYEDSYALGIHPLYIGALQSSDLDILEQSLERNQNDPRLVAIGEIGLDYFDPRVNSPKLRDKQWEFYIAQLKLAKKYNLPLILHSRQSVDMVLKGIRQVFGNTCLGIAHAFNGSMQQAQTFLKLGIKLGFGGACTYTRALHLQSLLTQLPAQAVVLETDAPDMVPTWLYKTALERSQGLSQGRNTPSEIVLIAHFIASLQVQTPEQLSLRSWQNLQAAIPRLSALLK